MPDRAPSPRRSDALRFLQTRRGALSSRAPQALDHLRGISVDRRAVGRDERASDPSVFGAERVDHGLVGGIGLALEAGELDHAETLRRESLAAASRQKSAGS